MKANEGSLERIIRLILGLIVLSLWFVLQGNAKYLALIGLIPLITAILGWCPLYSIFGINTCKRK
ncbi:putative transmembrane protein [Desulfosporosinus sp. I2]|uniref:YgaP family membrane protein n=1 Tax=Desulfosporosinus sp. I2 TaxID=1617025 RepID=UPI0005EF8BD6|nr:DUF2892 domain-containing protein [Desulfosporosinus sp. I2]KJR45947.1 putative transmembrane protein [Desulfosporosinus sp. I2]